MFVLILYRPLLQLSRFLPPSVQMKNRLMYRWFHRQWTLPPFGDSLRRAHMEYVCVHVSGHRFLWTRAPATFRSGSSPNCVCRYPNWAPSNVRPHNSTSHSPHLTHARPVAPAATFSLVLCRDQCDIGFEYQFLRCDSFVLFYVRFDYSSLRFLRKIYLYVNEINK